jgi:hypothetical protein
MADLIRFKLDCHQVNLLVELMETFLAEGRPRGETLNLIYSIVEGVNLNLKKRQVMRRLEYAFILPVHQMIALRRMAMAGLELFEEGPKRNEMRMVLSVIDPKMVAYTR